MKVLSDANGAGPCLGDRIRMARHKAKLSQATLAMQLGVTPGAVAQWENPNGTRPRIERLDEISKVTGAVFDWLVVGRGNARRSKAVVDPQPALPPEAFAQDTTEEMLLDRFRRLPPRARAVLCTFLEEIATRRR